MSIVAPPPLPHLPFSDTELYTHNDQTDSRPLLVGATKDNLSVPFPVFIHRHSNPFPVTHSFSALGPPEILAQQPVPHTPRPSPITLPQLSCPKDVDPTTGLSNPSPHVPFPPTPDPSPPNSRVIFPDAMVKLAPPAKEGYRVELHRDEGGAILSDAETPRRLPLASLDAMTGHQYPSSPESHPDTPVRPRSKSQLLANIKSPETSKPTRPKAMKRSQTAMSPSSIRMVESNSADSRARLRSEAMLRHSHSRSIHTRPPSPGFARVLADPKNSPNLGNSSSTSTNPNAVIPTPRQSSASDEPDLGGPDGLEAKVVLLGSQGVGKTSLILRYTTRQYSSSPAAATIGSSLHTRKLVHSGVRVKLQIWDTAGQERFRSMAPIYYRGAHVCVLVYDISDRTSFDDVRSWLEELRRTVPKETVIYVVGAKVDLTAQRAVSLDEAKTAIRRWLRPATPPVPSFLSPPSNQPFRSYTTREASRPDSIVTSPTPARSQSHDALASLHFSSHTGNTTPAMIPLAPPAQDASDEITSSSSIPFPRSRAVSPPPLKRSSPGQSSQMTSPKLKPVMTVRTSRGKEASDGSGNRGARIRPRSEKRLSFPALASPTLPTFATNTDHVSPSITPATPSRHGTSGGRFSISGVLGYSRTSSMSGAASNLARLAEEHPATAPKASILLNSNRSSIHGYPSGPAPSQARQSLDRSVSPHRVRIDTSAFSASSAGSTSDFGGIGDLSSNGRSDGRRSTIDLGSRRKSEEWTSAPDSRNSKSWRMGEGPSAAEVLGEFGDGVRKRQSEELLSSSGSNMARGARGTPSGNDGSSGTASGGPKGTKDPTNHDFGRSGEMEAGGRRRGGSLGRDSRLYGLGYGDTSEAEDIERQWGIDVESVRLGECSAMTGEGVEALFKSISSMLVQKKDKIERERTIRRQGSVMLTDPKIAIGSGQKEGRGYGCC